jgi:RNA exonuclease 4
MDNFSESPNIVLRVQISKKTPSKRRRRRRRKSNSSSESTEGHHNKLQNIRHSGCHRRERNCNKQRLSFPEESEFIALDCEMVGTGNDGNFSSVARVTLIDWFGEVLLDEYLLQTEPVTDYRTFVSGITKQDLDAATMTLDECRQIVLHLLDSHIIVGHALKNDLKALNITHPWWLTRDTAKYEPFMKVRFDDGILWPRKLKDLVKEKLHQTIQIAGQPHDSYEDALAALNLYRSVRSKWESIMRYKIEKTNQIQQNKQPTQ